MKASSFLILTEAGDHIGLGHLTRCSAIADFISDNDEIKCNILLNYKGYLKTALSKYIIQDWLQNLDFLNQDKAYNTVIVDSYLMDTELFPILKNQFNTVIAIDDYGRIQLGPDLIINPNIYGDSVAYQAKSVGGKEYIILRKAFRTNNQKLIIRDKVTNILITLGGSDYRQLLPKFIKSFESLPYHFDFICGNDEYQEELVNNFGQLSTKYHFHGFLSDNEMKNIMLKSDIAISACGQTLHELAFLGVPTSGVCIDKYQKFNMQYYVSVKILPEALYWNIFNIMEKIKQLIDTYTFCMRKKISSLSTQMVKSNGIENIYKNIL